MAGLPPGLAAYQAKHKGGGQKSGRAAAIQRKLDQKDKIIDPDGIPNSGDEYQIINGKKVMFKKTPKGGKPPWLK